ncbi:unnamed protein product [Arctogadus glacialis]
MVGAPATSGRDTGERDGGSTLYFFGGGGGGWEREEQPEQCFTSDWFLFVVFFYLWPCRVVGLSEPRPYRRPPPLGAPVTLWSTRWGHPASVTVGGLVESFCDQVSPSVEVGEVGGAAGVSSASFSTLSFWDV